MQRKSGLRGLEVAFPPHDPRDAGSNPAEVVEFLRTEKFGTKSFGRDFKPFDPCSRFTARKRTSYSQRESLSQIG
jgi:hypothetical protein